MLLAFAIPWLLQDSFRFRFLAQLTELFI